MGYTFLDDKMEVKRKMHRCGKATRFGCRHAKKTTPLSQIQADPKHVNRRDVHLRALRRQIVVVNSMLSLFGQLRWGYCFQSRSTHRKFTSATNPPRRTEFHDESSNVSSEAFSHCRHCLEILTTIKTKPDSRFRQHVPI